LEHDADRHALAAELIAHLLHCAQLFDVRDHRHHDPDVSPASSPGDRAKLTAQKVFVLEQHAHAAVTEERIILEREFDVWRWLVAADVEQADEDRLPYGRTRSS